MRITTLFVLAGCLDAVDETTATTDQALNGDTWTVVDDTAITRATAHGRAASI